MSQALNLVPEPGKIEQVALACCASCKQAMLLTGKSAGNPLKAANMSAWGQVDGVWFCPACL